MSRRCCLWTLALFTLAGLAGCGEEPDPFDVPGPDWSEPVSPTHAPASQLPRLRTAGADLVTSTDGKPVRLRGVNVCSLEFDPTGAVWELGDDGSALLEALADPRHWNANAVRAPVNQQWFLEDPAYAQRVERILDDADRRGFYVLLDVHWEQGRALDPYQANILEMPTFGLGNTTEAFWHRASSRFANRTNVLYDLVNEPHGQPEERTSRSMQALVGRIHSRTPEVVIVVGGMNWAHSLDYYRRHPLQGGNLIYSAHQYLPYDQPGAFAANFAEAARTLPVILGELTVEEAYSAGRLYQQVLIEEAEASGVEGWMAWAIGCGFGKDDWAASEPLRYLAAKMRELNL